MNRKYLLISFILFILSVQAEKFDLQANLSQGLDERWEKVASVELSVDDGNGYIMTDRLQLIPKEIISNASSNSRYLQLKLVSSGIEQTSYLTTVDLIQNFPKGEFKEVLEINVDEQNNINSFSYVVKPIVHSKKNKKKLNTDDEDIDEAFRVIINKQSESLKSLFSAPSKARTQQSTKTASQQQNNKQEIEEPKEGGIMGMIKDNFWYIMIGMVVLSVVGNTGGGEQAQGQAAAGQARPAQR